METRTEIKENLCGGKGSVILKHLLGSGELNGKCRMYAEVTINPGCSLGYHEHHGDSETYYIISGTGRYNDDGSERNVNPGDVTYTGSGHGHGIENAGDTPLVFMALIIYS